MSNEQESDDKSVEFYDVKSESAKKMETTLVFGMKWTNPETGEAHEGTFEAQRPNLRMLSEMAVIKARLSGGERIDASIDFMNEMIAYLQVTLTKFPEWWKPADFFDATPLRKAWDRVRGWQLSFRDRAVSRRSGGPTDDGGPAAPGAVAPEVVVSEVRKTA